MFLKKSNFTRACDPRRPAGCLVSEMKFYSNIPVALRQILKVKAQANKNK